MPLSDDPEKRARSLANLQRGRETKAGNRNAGKHMGRGDPSNLPEALKLTARTDIYAQLAEDAPVRDRGGTLPAADKAMVELAANQPAHVRHVNAWLDENGLITRKGKPQPVLSVLDKLERRLADSLAALGMTPRSRAALGVDLVKTVDIAKALSEKDPAKREAMLKEAGIIEGTAEEIA